MFRISRKQRYLPFAAALLVATVIACDDDPTDIEEHEPDVDSVQLVIGGTTVTISGTGVVTGGPVTIPVGNTSIVATFLNADGDPDPIAMSDEFRLEIVSDDEDVVSFTSTGGFAGTLVGGEAGATVIDVQLFHIEEGHEDFSQPLPVTVE